MPYLLFLKKRQNLQLSSAANLGGGLRVNLLRVSAVHQRQSTDVVRVIVRKLRLPSGHRNSSLRSTSLRNDDI